MNIDYLAILGASIQQEDEGNRLLYRGVNALFGKVTPTKLHNELNRAIAFALPYYRNNVSQTTLTMSEQQLNEIAIVVAAHHICRCNVWREHKSRTNTRCTLTARDVLDIDLIMDHCKKEFNENYALYAAALLGISVTDFLCREAERLFYYNK